jgi:hypothetical protein
VPAATRVAKVLRKLQILADEPCGTLTVGAGCGF